MLPLHALFQILYLQNALHALLQNELCMSLLPMCIEFCLARIVHFVHLDCRHYISCYPGVLIETLFLSLFFLLLDFPLLWLCLHLCINILFHIIIIITIITTALPHHHHLVHHNQRCSSVFAVVWLSPLCVCKCILALCVFANVSSKHLKDAAVCMRCTMWLGSPL